MENLLSLNSAGSHIHFPKWLKIRNQKNPKSNDISAFDML